MKVPLQVLLVICLWPTVFTGCQSPPSNDSVAQDRSQTHKIEIKTPNKTVYLKSDDWKPMINEHKWALNFSGKKEGKQVYGTVLTFYLLPMSPDRKVGKKISSTEYIQLFHSPVSDGAVTVQVRVDKGDYWILTRDTYRVKYTKPERVESDSLVYDLIYRELQPEIDTTRFFIRSDL